MGVRYFFAHEAEEFGPFSAARMRELAVAGEILPTDVVWQEGTERRVLAADVKNLFSRLSSMAAPASGVAAEDKGTPGGTALADSVIVDTAENQAAPPPAEEAPKTRYVSEKKTPLSEVIVRKRRVTSIKGAVLINQDGVSLNFRKKCEVCGYEDLSKSSAKIPVGSTRVNFFCRECRKMRRVEIHGSI